MATISTEATRARAAFRGGLVVPTAGRASGYVQANLVAVPADRAYDMLLFAQRNPRSCPILEVVDAGCVHSALAPEADLRTDLPRYRVWRYGAVTDEPTDVVDVWRDDLVTFVIGCSFTFDAGLARAGIPVRHVELGRNVPMYVTNRRCRSAGRLDGPLVVSMRPIPAALVARAVTVSAALPAMHGAPVHVGAPSELGVADLARPDYGDAVPVGPGEVPVFWACGVTPQAALAASRLPFAITHAPGHMFVTDARVEEYL
ncbi:putative hydro-lyase [Embleya sp. NBC_00896]|uniref:putative hydro-lyase n=1 Tax=Embleya sp. NBC_00896 TaxID=2975961 RepID=UPI00387098A2|nr:putative hydro-lyase [Embleya sp. NBC_00896]